MPTSLASGGDATVPADRSKNTKLSWVARVWAEFHADRLTRGERDVLLTLHTYRGSGGYCIPAHTTLAQRVRCSVRTVQRALVCARDLGLVSWAERRVRQGWRWLRTSNVYRFQVPADAPPAPPAPPARTTGQNARGGERHKIQEASKEEICAAQAALAARRAVFESRFSMR